MGDGLLTYRAKKEELSATRIAAAFQKVEQCAFDNGMSFDLNKFEAIHFSQKRNFDNVNPFTKPRCALQCGAPDSETKTITYSYEMAWSPSWLSVIF